jgi:hypothetical protein
MKALPQGQRNPDAEISFVMIREANYLLLSLFLLPRSTASRRGCGFRMLLVMLLVRPGSRPGALLETCAWFNAKFLGNKIGRKHAR